MAATTAQSKGRRKPAGLSKGSKDAPTKGSEPEDEDEQDLDLSDFSDDDHTDDDSKTVKTSSKAEEQNAQVAQAKEEEDAQARHQEIEEARQALEALDPTTSPVRWIVGKPPEMGGKKDQYSIYTQDKLPWMARQKFFALVGKTMAKAIRESGGDVGGMSDVFGDEGGSIVERGRRLTQRDFTDAASFAALAFELVGVNDQFLTECYLIWLNVPRDDRGWARRRFNEPWNPEEGEYGLKDDQHEMIIQTFIDQNYEDIRRFFIETLPALAKRVALHEKATDRQGRE